MEGLIIYTGCLNSNQIVWGWHVWVRVGLPSVEHHSEHTCLKEPNKWTEGKL